MPIRWSALKVSEAASMIEEVLSRAREPLEDARVIIRETRTIPELPMYITQDLDRLQGKIDDCLGGTQWQPDGWMKKFIEAIREDIPTGAIQSDENKAKYGSTPALV